MMRQRFPPPVYNPRRIFEKPVPRFDQSQDEVLGAEAAQGYILRPSRRLSIENIQAAIASATQPSVEKSAAKSALVQPNRESSKEKGESSGASGIDLTEDLTVETSAASSAFNQQTGGQTAELSSDQNLHEIDDEIKIEGILKQYCYIYSHISKFIKKNASGFMT